MNYEQIAVSDLRRYPRNARTHSRKQIRQIASSIERFGFCNPVLVDDEGQIIAGHGRVEAAKLLGLKEVPTVRLSHLSDDEKRAYILADNQLAAKSRYDREILAIELQHLVDIGFDVELTGFETADIDLLMEDVAQGSAADDAAPAYPKGSPVSRRGDLWLLGKHRLFCGDARAAASYEKLMGANKAQFVISDVPYNLKLDGHAVGSGRIHHADFIMASGEMSCAEFTSFLKSVFEHMCSYSTDGSIHELFIDWRHLREMLDAGEAAYSELKNLVIWNKSIAGMGSMYRSKHELIFVWKNGTASHINNFELGQHGRYRTNVWDYDGVNSAGRRDELKLHPTVKPVALIADAIKDCSRRGGGVLDPFAGSGTILIAAERTGRIVRAMELDAGYVDVAIKRWQEFSGKPALLAPLEETFEEVAEQRSASAAAA